MSQEYSQYLLEHINNVNTAYKWLVDHNIVSGEAAASCHDHDLSKYTTDEYQAYDDYFYGESSKAVDDAFNYAWLHHIHNNPHHWQYWVLINDEDGTVALEMPEAYVTEMIADWWSFSFKTGNLYEIFNWYKTHKLNIMLHKNTKKLVEEILDKIKKALDEESKNESGR